MAISSTARLHPPLEGAAERRADRDGGAAAVRVRALDDALGGRDRVGDGGTLVALVESLCGGKREMHLAQVRRRQPVVALLVQDEARVAHAVAPLDRLHDLLRARHLGHARGADETGRLDARDTGPGQPVDELRADGRLEDHGIVLQAVPRRDVADRDGCRAQITPSSGGPRSSSESRAAAVDLGVWLPSSHVADQRTRRVRQLGDDARSDVRPELRVDVLEEHLAGLVLRILEDVGDRVDRAADHPGLVQDAVDLGRVVPGGPLGDDALDLVLIVPPREVRGDAGVVGELGTTDRVAEPSEHVVGVGRDHVQRADGR
jgi:hypothetical protein